MPYHFVEDGDEIGTGRCRMAIIAWEHVAGVAAWGQDIAVTFSRFSHNTSTQETTTTTATVFAHAWPSCFVTAEPSAAAAAAAAADECNGSTVEGTLDRSIVHTSYAARTAVGDASTTTTTAPATAERVTIRALPADSICVLEQIDIDASSRPLSLDASALSLLVLQQCQNRTLCAGCQLRIGYHSVDGTEEHHSATSFIVVVQATTPATSVSSPGRLVSTTNVRVTADVTAAAEAHEAADQYVGGLDEYVEQLRVLVRYPMLHAHKFAELNVEAPKGVLLYGPPGTGKTLIVSAIARECKAHLVSVSDFVRTLLSLGLLSFVLTEAVETKTNRA